MHGQPRAAEVQVRVCVSVQQAPRNNKDNYLPLRMNESENEWSNGWSKKIKCLPQAAAFPVQRLFVHTPMILGRQLLHGVVTTQGPHVPPEQVAFSCNCNQMFKTCTVKLFCSYALSNISLTLLLLLGHIFSHFIK